MVQPRLSDTDKITHTMNTHRSADIFSLPGFQSLTTPRQEEHIDANIDGSIDVVFYKDRPLKERTPVFYICIGKEFGNQVTTYRDFNNQYVTSERDQENNKQHYRFCVPANEITILPGNYVLRFFADDHQVNVKYLCVKNSLLQSRHLPPSFLA